MEGMLNYFVPEDGDSSDHYNVVPLPRVEKIRLQDVKKCFPLPGEFHFRFKTPFEGTYVWLDIVDDNEAIPDYNGLIISKVARVARSSRSKPAVSVKTSAEAQNAPDLIETSEPTPKASQEETASSQKAFNDDLVGLLSEPIAPAQSPHSQQSQSTSSPQHQSNNSTSQDPFNLFMGSTASQPVRPAQMNAPQGTSSQGYNTGYNNLAAPSSSTMGPRPGMNMNISQMGQHMGMNAAQQQQPQHNFQGLQWQGMGHQSGGMAPQQRPHMGMQQQNSNTRQW